ncbi:MAG: hypothetical protein HZT43_00635 [Exiguobacterium profundum]|nr:MAG: hypothetical protein HZT43_00635 [Exiguobacterium profundum]
MIFGLARLAIFLFVVLTILFFLLRIYARSLRREALEETWDQGGIDQPRDDYIRHGMESYEKGLFLKLLWLVYIIPTIVISALVYFLNFYQ